MKTIRTTCKEKKKKIIHWLFLIFCFAGALLAILFPKKLSSLLVYKPYVVLTDSMVPRIPVFSTVFVRTPKEGEIAQIEPGQIITFRAMRFGESMILTHHFHHREKDEEGNVIYRTIPEGQEELDPYEIKEEDILGLYVFHIPYLGKYILFFQSQYGRLTLMEMLVLFLGEKLLALILGDRLDEPLRLGRKKRKQAET